MGPLKGYKVVEIAGIGPTQLCGMLLAEMGAEVIRLDRPLAESSLLEVPAHFNLMNRSRPSIAVDLKSKQGRKIALRLCEDADALIEGFRPGVMERLGLGPEVCTGLNGRLVYGRMTGWGQQGPWARVSGHDHNYLALSGAQSCIGDKNGPPIYPTNLIADFGGGAAYLAMGVLAAMLEATRSGQGQVVDAAMIDGVSSMMTLMYGMHAAGTWSDDRGSNLLDGGAPFARPYRTADGHYITVAPLEPRFFSEFLALLEITDIDVTRQYDRDYWPSMTTKFEQVIATRTRDEWDDLLAGSDACYAPVLNLTEVPEHPHIAERETLVEVNGITQPAPAPRFSRTPSAIKSAAQGQVAGEPVLRDWGLSESEIRELLTQ